MTNSQVPGWLAFAGSTLVAVIFAGGLVALLLGNHPVPDQLWVLDGVIATAYFGSGPFWGALNHAAATNTALLATVDRSVDVLEHAVMVLGPITPTSPTNGPATTGSPPVPAPA